MSKNKQENNAEKKQDPPAESQIAAKETPDADAKAQEYRDQLLRMKADFENTKKRLERDKVDAIKFANERLLQEILPIVDNLDRAMTSLSEGHDPGKVKQGLKIAQEEVHKVLELHGVEVVKSVGTEFDPKFHEAVAVVEDADVKDGTIVDEIQRGYILNGRLIRPSRVRISQKRTES
jgi:molecular chaperone GrpE